jgi:hypothetical protein
MPDGISGDVMMMVSGLHKEFIAGGPRDWMVIRDVNSENKIGRLC